MTVILDDHKLTYVAVPKIACTSIKTMFFEVENGFAFRMFRASGRQWHIHNFYPSVAFDTLPLERMAEHRRLAVLRDPVRRLLSCYGNRVVHHRELSRAKAGRRLARADLPLDPDLPTFVRNLAEYRRAVPSIDHHARPMVDYMGRDPDFYAGLFRMEALSDFTAEVARITGVQPALARLQTGGPKIDADSLDARDRRLLEEHYAEDYACYGSLL